MKKAPISLSDHFTWGKLLRFTLPSVVMMIVTSVYSVVDGFFVSNFVGKTPFAAVNLIMPFLQILGAVGFMLGSGGAALVSKTCGEGDLPQARRYFSLFTYAAAAAGGVLTVLSLVFLRPIAALLGAEGALLEDCVVYARIILAALPFYILQVLFQSFLSAAEQPKLGLLVTVLAGLTNLILDALLVMLLPQPCKLAGAAFATAAAQVVGGTIPLVYFLRNRRGLLRLCRTKWDAAALKKACANGSSEFMSNVSMSLVGMVYNLQLMRYAGEDGIAAYGVMMYVSFVFAAAFLGYSMGIAPVVGYHYGAGHEGELQGLLKKSLLLTSALGTGMVLAAQLLAAPLSAFFVGYDAQLLTMTVSGFRIFSLSFCLMGFGIFTSAFFTALNNGLVSALISFLRTLVFEVGSVLLLPLFFEAEGIWASVCVSELMSALLSAAFLFRLRNKYRYFP